MVVISLCILCYLLKNRTPKNSIIGIILDPHLAFLTLQPMSGLPLQPSSLLHCTQTPSRVSGNILFISQIY